MISRLALVAFSFAATTGLAQRADCPPVDAPMPMQPPGAPPPFTPRVAFPNTWEEANREAEPPKSGEIPSASLTPHEKAAVAYLVARHRANDDLLDAEDGHLAGLVLMAKRAQPGPAPGSQGMLADASRTRLSAWRLEGYLQEGSSNNVSRFFKRDDGSLLYFKEWDFQADGGAVHTLPGAMNQRVGRHQATMGGLRGSSGCIQSSLTWHDERKLYRLEIVGPLALPQQRAALLEIANSIATVADSQR